MISLTVVWVFKVCCTGIGCRCVCRRGDGNVPMWVYIDSSVEHRKSNTKTDNITSSKPGRLAAKHKTWGREGRRGGRLAYKDIDFRFIGIYRLSILEDLVILN